MQDVGFPRGDGKRACSMEAKSILFKRLPENKLQNIYPSGSLKLRMKHLNRDAPSPSQWRGQDSEANRNV